MIRSQLNSYSGADPIWGFVALIASERYTGEAAVGIDPRVRLFAVDGRVYFAEREGDAPIGTRLVSAGVVSTAQLEAGVVQIGETTSVARLFQRQPSIDRDAVELTLELATEFLLESVANKAVGMPEVFPLRHHPSGVHHWLLSAVAPTSVPGAETFAAAATADEVQLIEEVAVEEVAVEEPVAKDVADVEGEDVAVENDSTVEEAAPEEKSVDVEPVVEAVLVEEAFTEETVVAESVVAPAPAFVLPTLRSFVLPAAEDDDHEAVHLEEIQPVDPPVETAPDETEASVETAILPEPASAVAPFAQQTLAPIPTLASLTLPILHNGSASLPMPEPEPLVKTEPATASSADHFFASLPEQPQYVPVHAVELIEPPSEPPKLASPSISMSDRLAPNPSPVVTFGEPTHNLAAVDIWEMVDVLTDDRHDDQQELVGSGAPEKRGRSWLRGKKG